MFSFNTLKKFKENPLGMLITLKNTIRFILQDLSEARALNEHPEKAAYIHMDACLLSSTKYVLFTLAENNRLQKGTVIQFDELFNYYNWWEDGEYKALTEFAEKYNLNYSYSYYHSIFSSGHISRAASIIIN